MKNDSRGGRVKRKSAIFYTFIFLFIFVSAYVLCDIASNQHMPEYLANSVNLFSIAVAEVQGRSGTYISEAEYESLDSLIDKLSMCCHAFSHTGITAMRTMHNANIIFTDYRYAGMNGMEFAYGNYFTEENQADGDLKAVIDRKTAWELFGTANDTTGLTIGIFGREFEIIGVAERDAGLIQDINDDEINVYIPISALKLSGEGTGITGILVNFPDDVPSYEGKDRIARALEAIGENPYGYRIKSLRTTAAMIRMFSNVFICIIAIIAAAIIISHLYAHFSESIEEFRNNVVASGYKDSFKKFLTGQRFLMPAVYLVLIVFIYLPARSGVSVFLDFYDKDPGIASVHEHFIECFSQGIHAGSVSHWTAERLFVLSSCSLLAGILAGLPVLLSGMSFLKKLADDWHTLLIYSGIAFLLITLLVIASCALAGLEPSVRISSILVIWILFTVILADRKGSVSSTNE